MNASCLGFAFMTAALAPLPVHADPADFYRGKTIEILVGFSAGGGYDAYARAVARTFGSHVPGNPQVVVKNFMGAGSLRLARFLQEAAPRDGLTFGTSTMRCWFRRWSRMASTSIRRS